MRREEGPTRHFVDVREGTISFLWGRRSDGRRGNSSILAEKECLIDLRTKKRLKKSNPGRDGGETAMA